MFDWLNWFGFIDYDLNPDLADWLDVEKESLLAEGLMIDEIGNIHYRDEMDF